MTFDRILIVGVLLSLAYVGTYGCATFLAKQRVVDALIQAAEDEDREAIKGRVDWPALRNFLKSDLKRKSQSVRAGGHGVVMGPPVSRLNEIVEYYVQEDNIELLFRLRPKIFPNYEVKDFVHRVSLVNPFAFSVVLGYPKAPEGSDRFVQPTMSEQLMRLKVVFRLDGWTWRVKEMHVPLFMVPVNTYEEPAIERFLSEATR